MPLKIPPELKKITPLVRRAEELEKDKTTPESRLVAFYCRQYAVVTGISLAVSAEGKACLGKMLGDLETEKAAMSAFTRDEAKFLCRAFADKVFDKADAEDRAGQVSKNTAKTFYAAISFYQMLQQFYADDDDSEERQEEKRRMKHAKWRTTEILKAVKEGREPTPGGYGVALPDDFEDDDEDDDVGGGGGSGSKREHEANEGQGVGNDGGGDDNEGKTDDYDPLPPPPPASVLPPPREPDNVNVETVEDGSDDDRDVETLRIPDPEEPEENGTEVELGPPPAYPAAGAPSSSAGASRPPLTFSPPAPVAPPPQLPPAPTVKPASPEISITKKSSGFLGLGKKTKKLTRTEVADATELTRFALAALEDRDVELAIERLQGALKTLGR